MSLDLKGLARSYLRKLLFRYAPPEIMVLLKYLKSDTGKIFAKKNVYIANTLPVVRVLILAPHPDDEAIGMGGLLSMHLENHSKVTVLYMTDGGGVGAEKAEMAARRHREAKSLGEKYHVNQIFWNIEDTCLTNDNETIVAMVTVLEDVQPAIVYLPSFFEHHFDHFAANQILLGALERMSVPPITVIGYEVWDNIPFPNYVVDISSYFEKKKEILSHYVTALKATDFVQFCQNRNALHYFLHIDTGRTRLGYVEAFCRFDSDAYRQIFIDYLHALRRYGSPLLSHIVGGTNSNQPSESRSSQEYRASTPLWRKESFGGR